MTKRLILIIALLFFSLWSHPAQAGCNCRTVNNNPFGDWYGVNNSQQVSNPFGDWYGVNNMAQTDPNNPFADWYGVNNTGVANNPFADWYGVNNSGTATPAAAYQSAPQNYVTAAQYNRPIVYQANANSSGGNYYVAPTTGVDYKLPFIFAGLLTAGFFLIHKRRWIFA